MNSLKRQEDRTLKDELPRSVGAQYATGDQWRNNSTKKEGMEPKQKQHPVLDVTVFREVINSPRGKGEGSEKMIWTSVESMVFRAG